MSGFPYVAISLVDYGRKALKVMGITSDVPVQKCPIFHSYAGTAYEKVIVEGRSYYEKDLSSHPVFSKDELGHLKRRTFLGVPIKYAGDLIGIIGLSSRELDAMKEPLRLMVESIANEVAALIAHKAGEEKLQLSELKYRSMFDQAGEAIFVHEMDGTILDTNRYVKEMLHYEPSDLIGTKIQKLLLPSDNERIRDDFMNGADIRNINTDVTMLTKEGFPVDTELRASIMTIGDHQSVISNVRDTSHKKMAEEALQRSEEQFRRIVEMANEGILTIDEKGLIIFSNDLMAHMLGVSIDDLIGHPVEEYLFPEDLKGHRAKMIERKDRPKETYERRFRRKDGTEL